MLKVCSGYTTLTLAPKSANFILDCYYSNKKLPIQYERIIVLCTLSPRLSCLRLPVPCKPSPCADYIGDVRLWKWRLRPCTIRELTWKACLSKLFFATRNSELKWFSTLTHCLSHCCTINILSHKRGAHTRANCTPYSVLVVGIGWENNVNTYVTS